MKRAVHRANPAARSRRTAGLLAAGGMCALLVNPAAAVELGNIDVESGLGQPLRASIAFALAPTERLHERCVYLTSAMPASGLPPVTRARVSISSGRIVLRGSTPLREPMMSLTLVVDCPYTVHLRRDYLLLLNPPQPAAARTPAAKPSPVAATRTVSPPVAANRRARRQPVAAPAITTPVTAGRDYRVQPGDTLSGIASRIADRRVGLWPAVEAIFAANPEAFRDGDMDRLIAGANLNIPTSVVGDVAPTPTAVPAAAPAAVRSGAYPGPAGRSGSTLDERLPPRIENAGAPPADSRPAATAAAPEISDGNDVAGAATAGDAAQAADSDVAPAPRTAAAPAAEPAATERSRAPSPRGPVTKTVVTPVSPPPAEPIPLAGANDSPAQSWLVWLGGGGVAIFLALLIFGRRLRERFDGSSGLSTGEDLEETAINKALRGRRSTDRRSADAGHDGAPEKDTDFDMGDDMDVALDFSFAASGEFKRDLDFIVEESQITTFPPDEVPTVEDELSPTVEMPRSDGGNAAGAGSDDEADGLFAPPGERPKDLETIEVEALDSRPHTSPGIDLTSEFDYEILEQDYETELTGTYALSKEIEQAARELKLQLGDDDDPTLESMAEDLDGTAEVTAAMPAEMVPSQATAGNDAQDGADDALDDADASEAPTSRLPQSDETLEIDADATVEHRSKTG